MVEHSIDILILSNGPGEVSTWVRPVVKALRQQLGTDRALVRISVVLSPCTHAVGTETAIVRQYAEVDRVQSADHFFPFLFWGKTAENWDWRKKGIVLFLGGDQIFPLIIGKRLAYETVIYAEWEARWYRQIDRFGVMNEQVFQSIPREYQDKFTIVGDLMVDIAPVSPPSILAPCIALLPGSKPAKLAQGVPLTLAIAQEIHAQNPQTQFILPVAPTLDLLTLARFADRDFNPIIAQTGWSEGKLHTPAYEIPYIETNKGLKVELISEFPAYNHLSRCHLALTTVGANTAELGALGIPMIVLLPTQQLDAMRHWDGLLGILANLPGIGSLCAKIINLIMFRQKRLYAWPNIWAKEEIVPELLGALQPLAVANLALSWLNNPEELESIRQRLKTIRGESGAAEKLASIVTGLARENKLKP